jgi:hypothetical protein
MSSVRKCGHEAHLSFHEEVWAWSTSKFSCHVNSQSTRETLKQIWSFSTDGMTSFNTTWNLDVIQTQTSSWKLRWVSYPNFLTDDTKTYSNFKFKLPHENLDELHVQTSSPMTWKLPAASTSNFRMKTEMSFIPKLPHRRHANLQQLKLPHQRHENLDASWKLRWTSWPNFITNEMKT